MKIHPFKESDAAAVAKLSNENSTAFQYQKVTPAFLKRMCSRKDYKMFILKDTGQIIGFCGVNFRNPKIAEIGPVCVKNERRTHGLGRLLVNEIFDFLEPMDHDLAIVKVKASNAVGQEFFRSMGFKRAAKCSCGGVPAIVMEYPF